jgi:hypothetical protein
MTQGRRSRVFGRPTARNGVATISAFVVCVVAALSATHPVCTENFGIPTSAIAVSSASEDRVHAASEHEACQCDRCGACRWYQLRFVGARAAATIAPGLEANLRVATADDGLASGSSYELLARPPPPSSHR